MQRATKDIIKGAAMVIALAALCALVWYRSARIGSTREGLGRSFEFDLEQYLDVDPGLIKYSEALPIRPDAGELTAVCAEGTRIYVGAPGSILVLDSKGAEIARMKVDGTPACLDADANGLVYAGLGNHIEVFAQDGSRKAVWEASASNALPVSIALRGEDILVAEARKGEVHRYDLDGELLDSITGFILFSSPNIGIAVDSNQRLWAANPGAREIRCYEPNGNLHSRWNSPGRDIGSFSGCCNPVDIALLADGNIVTAEKDIVRVKVVGPTGELKSVVAGPRSFDQSISYLDIDVDPSGRVLVLDPVRNEIRVFVAKGSSVSE